MHQGWHRAKLIYFRIELAQAECTPVIDMQYIKLCFVEWLLLHYTQTLKVHSSTKATQAHGNNMK